MSTPVTAQALTTPELWSIASSIATILTGVVVGFYTWVTYKLRLDSKEQNRLLTLQLAVANAEAARLKEAADAQTVIDEIAADPIFRPSGLYRFSMDQLNVLISNDGGKIMGVIMENSEYKAHLDKGPSMSPGEVLTITFSEPLTLTLQRFGFVLRYRTMRGTVQRTRFNVEVGKPTEQTRESGPIPDLQALRV